MRFGGCSNFHFIQAIKDGTTTKVPNVLRRSPRLKLKNIQEAYRATDAVGIDPIQVVRPKIGDSPIRSYRNQQGPSCVKVEVDGGEEFTEPDPSSPVQGQGTQSDDLDFMTLKEMKAKCMENKRRCRGFACYSEGIAETTSPVKQEYSISPFEGDDADLSEPLIHWKSRISMSKRKKRKLRSNRICTSAKMNLSIVEYKGIQGDQQVVYQSSGDAVLPMHVKVEVPEPPYSDYQGEYELPLCSISPYDNWPYSGGIDSAEPETTSVWDWESKMLLLSAEEGEETEFPSLDTEKSSTDELECCFSREGRYVENEVLALTYTDCEGVREIAQESLPSISVPVPGFEFVINDEPETLNGTDLDCKISAVAYDEEHRRAKVNFSETGVSNMATKEHDGANDCGFQKKQVIDELQLCVLCTENYDHVERSICELVPDVKDSAQGNVLVNDSEVILQHPSDSFVDPCPSNDSSMPVFSRISQVADNDENSPASPLSLSKLKNNSSDNMDEVGNRPGSYLSEDGRQDGSSHLNAEALHISDHDNVISAISNIHSTPDDCLHPVSVDRLVVEKKPLFSACVNEKGNSPTKIYSDVDEPVATIEAEEFYLSKMQCPTQRLLSNRKIISPTSQKKLQKAMESAELDDEQYYKYTRKLCYMKQVDNRTDGLEGRNQIKRTGTTSSAKQLARKDAGGPYSTSPKGILKVSRPSRAPPRISTSCSSVKSCSESAIAFSQRQMRDIETIASKLTRELKCMKDIIEETLCSEDYAATPVKRTADEVGVVIRNATRVEEGARRWLSMMSRDCDRFCKIMKLTGKGPPAPGDVLSKEKRKIVFADEAGRKLCDVKIFVDDTNASTDSESAEVNQE